MSPLGGLLLCVALVACRGGGTTGASTTPQGVTHPTVTTKELIEKEIPAGAGSGSAAAEAPAAGSAASGDDGKGTETAKEGDDPTEVPIAFPNHDPDPGVASSLVAQQLAIAKHALTQSPPDAEAAMQAAREALRIDAGSVEAAAYVAFAFYQKGQYDTADLVLNELFKRPSAKQSATVYYVFGLVYDHTNRLEQAVLAYTRAVELAPGFSSALINLGVHQLRNKKYAEAQATFERLTREMGREDAVTLTSLGSAYRGRSADYPVGSGDRDQLILAADTAYKRAVTLNASYAPAYYNLGLLYLDADPFPSTGGPLDTLERLGSARTFLEKYKAVPGVDTKLYDDRMKDVARAIKREENRRKKAKKAGGGG